MAPVIEPAFSPGKPLVQGLATSITTASASENRECCPSILRGIPYFDHSYSSTTMDQGKNGSSGEKAGFFLIARAFYFEYIFRTWHGLFPTLVYSLEI